MATLSLAIGGSYVEGAANGGGAMLAELVPFDANGRGGARRMVTVEPSRPSLVPSLEAGNWEIGLLVPGGASISRDVELREEGVEAVLIQIPASAAPPAGRRPGSPSPVRSAFGNDVDEVRSTRSFDQGGTARFTAAVAVPLEPWSMIGPPGNGESTTALGRWARLAEGVDGGTGPSGMLEAAHGPPLEPAGAGAGAAGAWRLAAPAVDPSDGRTWFVVRRGGRMRVHSAPVPWTAFDMGDDVLLIMAANQLRTAPSAIRLVDPRYGGIVGYLAAGEVAAAAALQGIGRSDLLGRAAAELRGKGACPLGAAASGYVLVGTADLSREAAWHAWIGNLDAWFPWLPDGAILAARLRLLSARSEAQAREALPMIRRALTRGLPYFSVGVGWLLSSMAFFEHDRLVASALPHLRRIAAAMDMDAPFTTLDVPA